MRVLVCVFDFIVQKFQGIWKYTPKFCRREEDWLDAMEALGVRAVYYNGCHAAYLGKNKPCWTNATVAQFKTKEEAEKFCDSINDIFEID